MTFYVVVDDGILPFLADDLLSRRILFVYVDHDVAVKH